jgi:hypothetical protein
MGHIIPKHLHAKKIKKLTLAQKELFDLIMNDRRYNDENVSEALGFALGKVGFRTVISIKEEMEYFKPLEKDDLPIRKSSSSLARAINNN